MRIALERCDMRSPFKPVTRVRIPLGSLQFSPVFRGFLGQPRPNADTSPPPQAHHTLEKLVERARLLRAVALLFALAGCTTARGAADYADACRARCAASTMEVAFVVTGEPVSCWRSPPAPTPSCDPAWTRANTALGAGISRRTHRPRRDFSSWGAE